MQTRTRNTTNRGTASNASKVTKSKFQSILEEMMKLTKGGNLNLRTANKYWNIHYTGVPANDTTYTNYNTGA